MTLFFIRQGIHDLSFRDGELRQEHVAGKEAEGASYEVHQAVPKEPGWQVAIEVIKGAGFYTVVQQPAADNDWTAVLRVDDAWTKDNSTELAVWVVPGED